MAQAKEIVAGGDWQKHSLHAATDVDWVKFTLAQRSDVFIGIADATTLPEMWLYDSAGHRIATNNEGGVLTGAPLDSKDIGPLEAGTYYVKVDVFQNSRPIEKYAIRVGAQAQIPQVTPSQILPRDSFETDNTMAQAKVIATNGSLQTHSLHTTTDVDWVKFTLTKTSNVAILTNGDHGDAGERTELWLYDGAGNQIAYNWHGNGDFSRIDRSGTQALGPGTYYVKVGDFGSRLPMAKYTISVIASAPISGRYMLTEHWGGKWTDVEKSPRNRDDDNMCWAAACSNALAWTGWSRVNGTTMSADQVFQYYVSHWTDAGSLTQFGLYWWFNGDNPGQSWNGWAHVDVKGGNFFGQYYEGAFVHSVTGSHLMRGVDAYLHEGWIPMLSIYNGNGGHAITCWGFDYDPSTPGAYRGVWVTDSDDAKSQVNAPDQLRYYRVQLSRGQWYLQNYCGSNSWYIGKAVALEHRASHPDNDKSQLDVWGNYRCEYGLPEAGESGQVKLLASLAPAADRAVESLIAANLAVVHQKESLFAQVAVSHEVPAACRQAVDAALNLWDAPRTLNTHRSERARIAGRFGLDCDLAARVAGASVKPAIADSLQLV